MTTTIPTLTELMSDWEQETREHADSLRKATDRALRYGVNDSPQIADWIALPGVQIEGGEGILVSKDRVEHGPWVRVYDPTANHGDGAYAWAKGRVLIPDHAVESVRFAGDNWDAIAKLAGSWPVRPCSESLATYPTSDADDAETDADRAEADWCSSCEHMAPFQRVDGIGWVRVAHRQDGTPIQTAGA